MSGCRYHFMEVIGDPMLVPLLVSRDGRAPNPSPQFRKGESMADPLKCPQCGGPIATPISWTIIYQGRDERTGKKKVCEKRMAFCSEQCGLHCQYAHEG